MAGGREAELVMLPNVHPAGAARNGARDRIGVEEDHVRALGVAHRMLATHPVAEVVLRRLESQEDGMARLALRGAGMGHDHREPVAEDGAHSGERGAPGQ